MPNATLNRQSHSIRPAFRVRIPGVIYVYQKRYADAKKHLQRAT